jgi:transposase
LRAAFARAAEGADISADTIGRILKGAQLQPHRHHYFLQSRDPLYDEKRRAIVRLYLEPPPGATILSLDEKPNIQALSRRHPDLPMRPGRPVLREFEYVRHSVVHLFAAFNVGTGRIIAHVQREKTHVEFIELLERCAWYHRREPVHCIVDNASYHSTPAVKAWLADHPRFRFHYTPTHASWLNQVECWFSILDAKALRRGSFESQHALAEAIREYIAHWNAQAHPFNWTYGEELLHEQSVVAA